MLARAGAGRRFICVLVDYEVGEVLVVTLFQGNIKILSWGALLPLRSSTLRVPSVNVLAAGKDSRRK